MATSEQSILAQLEDISQVAARTVSSGFGDIGGFKDMFLLLCILNVPSFSNLEKAKRMHAEGYYIRICMSSLLSESEPES